MSEDNSESYNLKEENERQYRSIDQLLSMHSVLCEWYLRRAFILNTMQIGISLLLCGLAFVGDDVLRTLGLDPAKSRFLLGTIAVIVLILSITEFRVDWKAVGATHREATRHLAELKAKYRKAYIESAGSDSEQNANLTTDYERLMGHLPPIPERHFIQLKASHRFKIILSELVGRNPKTPVWFLRIMLNLKGMKSALQEEVD